MLDAPQWMGLIHVQILYYLRDIREDEGASTPKKMAAAIGTDPNYVSSKAMDLYRAGLVKRPQQGIYLIDEDGLAFLEGELDASDRERDPD